MWAGGEGEGEGEARAEAAQRACAASGSRGQFGPRDQGGECGWGRGRSRQHAHLSCAARSREAEEEEPQRVQGRAVQPFPRCFHSVSIALFALSISALMSGATPPALEASLTRPWPSRNM